MHPPHRTVIPYHKHPMSYTVFFHVVYPPNKPYHHTKPAYDITYRAPPHTIPHRTLPRTLPCLCCTTPTEGLDHTRTGEDHTQYQG